MGGIKGDTKSLDYGSYGVGENWLKTCPEHMLHLNHDDHHLICCRHLHLGQHQGHHQYHHHHNNPEP